MASAIRRPANHRQPRAGLGAQAASVASATPQPGPEHRFRLKTGPGWARTAILTMLKSYFQRLFVDPNGPPALVRRLLLVQAAGPSGRYAPAFGMMFMAPVATALVAYLVG